MILLHILSLPLAGLALMGVCQLAYNTASELYWGGLSRKVRFENTIELLALGYAAIAICALALHSILILADHFGWGAG